ncbi:hypothetical protein [Streptosporangium sp. NPDC006930]|uniref:hypothetical protein n=1 Tax=unclassified Streptosporangium TaxID=2632669 RepID=UPI003421F9A9
MAGSLPTTGPISPQWEATQLKAAEYTSLRSEIVGLTSLQFQTTAVATVSFGAVLSAGFQVRNAAIILIYPLLSLALGIIWLFKAHLITRIAAYLRTGIEDRVGRENMGWEHYVQDHPLPRGRFAYWGLRAIFPVTSMIAIGASFALAPQGVAMTILYILSFTVTIGTIAVFILWREPSPELGQKSSPNGSPPSA